LPASYTEKTIAEFMASDIGDIAAALVWTVGASDAGSYAEAVNDLLVLAGETAIGDVDVESARAYARLAVWQRVVKYLGGDLKYSADGMSFEDKNRLVHAQACLELAQIDVSALTLLDDYEISRSAVENLEDPYETAYVDPLGRT